MEGFKQLLVVGRGPSTDQDMSNLALLCIFQCQSGACTRGAVDPIRQSSLCARLQQYFVSAPMLNASLGVPSCDTYLF